MNPEHVEPTLFEASENTTRAIRQRVFLVTNRYNLLDFASGRLITPAAGIVKYYDDALRYAPDRLLLLRAPFGDDLLEDTVNGDEHSFPVALEIDVARFVPVAIPALTAAGATEQRSLADDSAIAWAPSGVLPLRAVTAVHFRSQRDLEEHTARRFENIFDDTQTSNVSPELFTGGANSLAAIRGWLSGLQKDAAAVVGSLRDADRLSGALSLLAATLPPSPIALAGYADLLTPSTARAAPLRSAAKKPTKKGSPKRRASESGGQYAEVIPPWLFGAKLPAAKDSIPDLEVALFESALSVLRQANSREKWRALEALDAIQTRVLGGDLDERQRLEVARNLDPIRSILKLEREFRPLNTGKGLRVAKALLMVLMRHDPARLMAWDQSESGADDVVRMTAAFLVGALSGHKRLPTSLRTQALDDVLAERTAIAVSDIHSLPIRPADGPFAAVKESFSATGESTWSVVWRHQRVVTRDAKPKSLGERLVALDYDDAAVMTAGLDLARELGWSDCVTTTMTLPFSDFRVETRKGKEIAIVTAGIPALTHKLDAARFKERLLKGEIPPAIASRVEALAGAVLQVRRTQGKEA